MTRCTAAAGTDTWGRSLRSSRRPAHTATGESRASTAGRRQQLGSAEAGNRRAQVQLEHRARRHDAVTAPRRGGDVCTVRRCELGLPGCRHSARTGAGRVRRRPRSGRLRSRARRSRVPICTRHHRADQGPRGDVRGRAGRRLDGRQPPAARRVDHRLTAPEREHPEQHRRHAAMTPAEPSSEERTSRHGGGGSHASRWGASRNGRLRP